MQTLDKNVLDAIDNAIRDQVENMCQPLRKCLPKLRPICTEYIRYPECPPLGDKLNTVLTACGGEFYVKCPEFDQLGKVCDFEPAFEAAKLKDKVQQDRFTQLESQVKELQIALKKKG